MSHYRHAPEGKDPELWEIAQRRTSFKSHAISYVIVNAFLWALWYFSAIRHNVEMEHYNWSHFPWPVWPTLGWGIGLAFHFAGAYIFPGANSVEREYEKLNKKTKCKNQPK